MRRSKVVIDTNVAITANRAKKVSEVPEVELEVVLESVRHLKEIIGKNRICLDFDGEIFSEYSKYLSFSGAPGVGDEFFKWIHTNNYNENICELVEVERTVDGEYVDFPSDDTLMEFDLADRKFVAVSVKADGEVPILQATDSKWWGWKDALNLNGVVVKFVSAAYIEMLYNQKMGEAM